MSFILDALKKSESERQRQSGPALFEVKIAPPRHRFAIWAAILGSLLAINLGVVGWMLAHRTPARTGEAGETASAAAEPAAAVPATARPPEQPAASAAEALPPGTPAAAGTRGAAGAPAVPETAPASGRLRSAARSAGAGAPLPAGSAAPPAATVAHRAPGSAAEASADSAAAAGENPADLAPAVAAPQSAVPQSARSPSSQGTPVQDGGGSVIREPNSGLPTYQELASQPGSQLPQLDLDLHVYSPQPDQRFVFLNMTKLREGDTLPQGVRVDTITPSGVILSYHGKRFVLQR